MVALCGVSKKKFFKIGKRFFSNLTPWVNQKKREIRRKGASEGVSLKLDFPIAYKMSQKPAEALEPGSIHSEAVSTIPR